MGSSGIFHGSYTDLGEGVTLRGDSGVPHIRKVAPTGQVEM